MHAIRTEDAPAVTVAEVAADPCDAGWSTMCEVSK